MSRVPLATAVAAVLSLPTLACGPKSPPATGVAPATTSAEISAADLRSRLSILADDSMQGRRSGTRGNVKGTDYIAAEARRIGLEPAGENGGWFQTVPMVIRVLPEESAIEVDGTRYSACERLRRARSGRGRAAGGRSAGDLRRRGGRQHPGRDHSRTGGRQAGRRRRRAGREREGAGHRQSRRHHGTVPDGGRDRGSHARSHRGGRTGGPSPGRRQAGRRRFAADPQLHVRDVALRHRVDG